MDAGTIIPRHLAADRACIVNPGEKDVVSRILRYMQEDIFCVAARHVAIGRRIVARQRALVVQLEENGYSTVEAARALDLFEQTLAIFEDHYRDILTEITEPGGTQV
jgi:hypothetical protein